MTKKTVVILLSIVCITVWSLVILQLVLYSPSYSYEEASNNYLGAKQLQTPSELSFYTPPTEIVGSETMTPSESKAVDSHKANEIRIDGLTKEDMLEIAIDKSASIDTLLYVLNISTN